MEPEHTSCSKLLNLIQSDTLFILIFYTVTHTETVITGFSLTSSPSGS